MSTRVRCRVISTRVRVSSQKSKSMDQQAESEKRAGWDEKFLGPAGLVGNGTENRPISISDQQE